MFIGVIGTARQSWRMRSPRSYVEVLGPPGAGKTTLFRELLAYESGTTPIRSWRCSGCSATPIGGTALAPSGTVAIEFPRCCFGWISGPAFGTEPTERSCSRSRRRRPTYSGLLPTSNEIGKHCSGLSTRRSNGTMGMQTVAPQEGFWIDEGLLSLVLSITKRRGHRFRSNRISRISRFPRSSSASKPRWRFVWSANGIADGLSPLDETPAEQRANQAAIHARLTDVVESLPDTTTVITVSNTGTGAAAVDEINRSLRTAGGRSRRYS